MIEVKSQIPLVLFVALMLLVGCVSSSQPATPITEASTLVSTEIQQNVATKATKNGPTPTLTVTYASTAVATSKASETPTTTAALHTPTPPTVTPATAVRKQTPILIPLGPMTPFPTVTPDYVVPNPIVYDTENKAVFLSFGGYYGDGGSNVDGYYGRFTPDLIIFGDGQFLVWDGVFGETGTFLESRLSPNEMCDLRLQIEVSGFLESQDEVFSTHPSGAGAGYLGIQVEDIVTWIYGGDVLDLKGNLASGIDLIHNYRPSNPLNSYSPEYLLLHIEEVLPDEEMMPLAWPSELPELEELWRYRGQNQVVVEGNLVEPIFTLFSKQMTQLFFQEEDTTYGIIARPLLPHETPEDTGYAPPSCPDDSLWQYSGCQGLIEDYLPIIDCEDEPALLPTSGPTPTPTLTAPDNRLARLSGQGRIAFVAGIHSDLGTYILEADGTRQDQEIYVMEADGTNQSRLTYNRYADDAPAWSPDGQKIVFHSERNGQLDIFMMNADGTDMVQLTYDESADHSPAWSPDGDKITFISNRDGEWLKSEIYTMNADGTEPQRLTENVVADSQPVWSPDGSKIAYIRSTTLAVLHHDGPEVVEEKLPYWLSQDRRPAWSPDSSQIAFVSGFDDPTILITNLDGSEAQSFSVLPLTEISSLDWSENGQFIVFEARENDEPDDYLKHLYFDHWGIYALDLRTAEVIQITYTEYDERSPNLWPR